MSSRIPVPFDRALFLRLTAIDLVLVGITAAAGLLVVRGHMDAIPDILNVGRDWSLGEVFNYAKWGLAVAVLGAAYRRDGARLHLGLAACMAALLIDDAAQLHERGGAAIGRLLDGRGWIAGTALSQVRFRMALGEVVSFGLIAAPAVLICVQGMVGAPAHLRRTVRPLAALAALGAVFAVAVDAAHSYSAPRSLVGGVLLLLEEGGEMVVTSAIAAYVAAAYGRAGRAAPGHPARVPARGLAPR